MKKKIWISFLSFLLMGIFLITYLPVQGAINYGEEKSQILEDPNVVIRGTSKKDEINVNNLLNEITYDDNVTNWYIVYPTIEDANADGLSTGDLTTVVYNDINYENVEVFIGNQFDGGIDNIIEDNTTIFFKDGTYTVSAGNGYYGRLYKKNLSLIGLNNTIDNPGVYFDLGYKSMLIYSMFNRNQNTRHLISDDFYVANILFDAGNREMKSNEGNSTGQYYLHFNSSKNVVFDNVTIANVANNFYGSANVTINAINADTVIFNNTTIKNCASALGYAPIQINNSSRNIYFNNIKFDNVIGNHDSTNKPFIKIEDGATYTDNISLTSVFFTGIMDFINMSEVNKSIYVESYKYDTIAFPSDIFRYAQLRNENGSWINNYIGLQSSIPVSASDYAIFDLADNTFVIKKDDTLAEDVQIQNTIDTLAFIRSIKGDTKSEFYNIKYEVGSSLGTINLPEINVSQTFSESYFSFFENILLNVIPINDRNNTIETIEMFNFIPEESNIVLPDSNNRYQIFNIDFDNIAGYTLQEVVDGISSIGDELDLNISLYGLGDVLTYQEYFSGPKEPIISNSKIDDSWITFHNSIFTSLVQKIQVNSLEEIPTVLYVGDTISLEANFENTFDNSYSHSYISSLEINQNTANDSELSVKWFSSDTSVATVDEIGNVNIIAPGTVDIIAKAIDLNNEGEIEKPWGIKTISTKALSLVEVSYVDTEGNVLHEEIIKEK